MLPALLIGIVAGLRSLTAPAVVAWAAHLNWLNLQGTPFAFMRSTVAVLFFTSLGFAELVEDQIPSTPARTKPSGLIARIVTGGLSGACVAASGAQSLAIGACLGAAGGIAGAFCGYQARRRLVKALNVRDLVIALLEDAVAIGAGLVIVSQF